MRDYIDDKYAVSDGVLINCFCDDFSVRLPAKLGEVPVEAIGNGAFMELPKLQSVILPNGIKEIGDRAFYGCLLLSSVFIPGSVEHVGDLAFNENGNLFDVTVYGLKLSAEEYVTLKTSCVLSGEGIYVCGEFPEHPLLVGILKSAGTLPAVKIPFDAGRIFRHVKNDKSKGGDILTVRRDNINFEGVGAPTTEDSAFMELIKRGRFRFCGAQSEELNDRAVRMGTSLEGERVAIFTFDDSLTRRDGEGYLIQGVINFGAYFWQSARDVLVEGVRYYVYSRYYLSGEDRSQKQTKENKPKYIRKEIAIYNDSGLVVNKAEARKVYAKYKFLSIL